MNIFKKIYHRAFGSVMRVLLPLFPYREPLLIDGMDGVGELLYEKGISRVMTVTDKGIRSIGLTASLEKSLEKYGVGCVIFDGTLPNPTSDNVEAAVKMYTEAKCEALVAFGGGSAIDCAKAVGARIVRPSKPLSKMQGLLKVQRKLPLFIAIPTTAGTGSEATVASVIVDSKTRHKYVINDFCLIPEYALLDATLTVGLPKHLVATTGMDALTHAIEVYIGKAMTKKTRAASERAIELIFENIEKVYEGGEPLPLRLERSKKMLEASYLAGVAFTRSYVGYVHAVSHTLSGRYNTPHGLANAVLLPHVLRAYGDCVTKPLARLARKLGLADAGVSDSIAKDILISHIEGMNERMGIPTSLPEIKKEDIPEMARLADKEAHPLYPTPCLYDAKELETLYHLVSDEQA